MQHNDSVKKTIHLNTPLAAAIWDLYETTEISASKTGHISIQMVNRYKETENMSSIHDRKWSEDDPLQWLDSHSLWIYEAETAYFKYTNEAYYKPERKGTAAQVSRTLTVSTLN